MNIAAGNRKHRLTWRWRKYPQAQDGMRIDPDYSRALCPANCDCGDCYHNPELNCHCFVDPVAEAIWRAASGGGVGYPPGKKFGDGMPTDDQLRYRLMARAAIEAMQTTRNEGT